MISNEALDEVIKYIKLDMEETLKKRDALDTKLIFLRNVCIYLASIGCEQFKLTGNSDG